MKIWLDDVREPPDNSWTWARSSAAAIALLTYPGEPIESISLDHDLGTWDTGMPVARFIAGMQMRPKVLIHSMNPVGRANMEAVLAGADNA